MGLACNSDGIAFMVLAQCCILKAQHFLHCTLVMYLMHCILCGAAHIVWHGTAFLMVYCTAGTSLYMVHHIIIMWHWIAFLMACHRLYCITAHIR